MSESYECLEGFIRKLSAYGTLSDKDRSAIRALPCSLRVMEPAGYIVREGEPPKFCTVLDTGCAFRQKLTGDGARQIVSLRIPGDPLDFQSLYLDVSDHNIQTLTRARVGFVPRAAIQDLLHDRPAVANAVMIDILIEASITREWLLNIGRRSARQRLAHLLCEFAMRMDAQGLTVDDSYELPMTQEQLGDALGLTSVHVNRTLKALEGEGVLTRAGRRIAFTGWQEVRRIADFSAIYLHLPIMSGKQDEPHSR